MLPSEWESDFRGPAIEASRELIPESHWEDPETAGLSCCLPTEHPRSALKTQKWLILACFIFGFGGLAGGAALAAWSERHEGQAGAWLLLGLAGCSSLAGFILLVLPVKGGGLFLRGYMGRRLDSLKSNPDISEIFYMGLEDPKTFSQMKIVSDDAGYLALDPVHRRIIIEGVLCRYIIRGEDIVRIRSHFASGSPGTLIVYRIGTTRTLGLMVEKMYLCAEVVRQLTGRARNPACAKIAAALGVEVIP